MKNGLKLILMFAIITTMSYSYQKNIDKIPDGIGDLYRTAQKDIEEKRYNYAIENMKRILLIDSENSEIRTELARVYNKIGAIEKSNKEYEISIKIENDKEVIFEYGDLCFKRKEYEKSFKIFQKDKTENYKNVFGAATAARMLGELEQSLDYYNRAISKNPEFADSYFGIAVVYQKKKNYDAAIENFKSYLKRKKSEDVYGILSSLYMLKKNYEKAKETLKAGLKEYPNSAKLKKLSKIASSKKQKG